MGLVVLLISVMFSAECIAESNVILKPTKTGAKEIGLVFLQGAQIQNNAYLPLLKHIQDVSPYSLWIGSPSLPLDVANPVDIGGGVQEILSQLRAAGMKTQTVFYAGHSLGGAMLPAYIKTQQTSAAGLILMGSFLQRTQNYSGIGIPTLTIGGDKDGLCRVTRLMESYYHQMAAGNFDQAAKNYPVVIVNGMNHFQFASGQPPLLVKSRDLKAEISDSAAYETVARTVSEFLEVQVDANDAAINSLNARVTKTGYWLQPLLTAFKLEGSYHIKAPCYNQQHTSACQVGCPWTEQVSQSMMGNLSMVSLEVTDEFHEVWRIPFHLPNISNTCEKEQGCKLRLHTVTEALYEKLDAMDTGFVSVSAFELRTKMKSRQAIWEAAGRTNIDFNKTDKTNNICAKINQQAYNMALRLANETTVARYMKLGRKLTMGKDLGPYNAGPLWIWNPLKYHDSKDSAGNDIVIIQSPMMYTPTDYRIQLSAGFHYCKLLSPARAMEWIYIDSLRGKDNI